MDRSLERRRGRKKRMLHMITYELIRQRNEERRERSLRRFWWRYTRTDDMVETTRDADVIELAFGSSCQMEEPIGA
jgi:hypothetical protein